MRFSRRALLVSILAGAALVSILAGAATFVTLSPLAGNADELGAINTLGSDGVAIRGTDPVAYFTESRPVAGDPAITLDYRGAEWRFASEENKSLFASEPEKYAPAYGGYCAYGVAQGNLVKIEPDAWTIHEGRLYLNYDLGIRDTWLQDVPGYIAKADQNFPKLVPGGTG
jgi:YHS domain-containing protein